MEPQPPGWLGGLPEPPPRILWGNGRFSSCLFVFWKCRSRNCVNQRRLRSQEGLRVVIWMAAAASPAELRHFLPPQPGGSLPSDSGTEITPSGPLGLFSFSSCFLRRRFWLSSPYVQILFYHYTYQNNLTLVLREQEPFPPSIAHKKKKRTP